MKRLLLPIVAVLVLATARHAIAAPPTATPAVRATVTADRLTPRERGELARAFVLKFGPTIEARYGTPVRTWARRSVHLFVGANPADFRSALARTTPEAALAALMGHGDRVTDASVTAEFARAAKAGSKAAPMGALHTNLTFTAVTPCRVVDTRHADNPPLPAGSDTTFVLFGTSSYLNQGGADEDCGMPINTSAVAINVTVVYPDRAGYTTVHPFGSPRPLASSLNYAAGAIVNNTVVTATPNPYAQFDIVLHTFASAHYVIDVVGYYTPITTPLPSLACTNARNSAQVVASASSTPFTVDAACATGEHLTGGACSTTQEGSVRWMVQGVTEASAGVFVARCAGQVPAGHSPTIEANARCCRLVAP